MFTTLRAILLPGLAVLIAAAPGSASDSHPEDDRWQQVYSRIDSLHGASRVDEAAAYAEPLLEGARAACDSSAVLSLLAKLGRLWATFGHPARGESLLVEAIALARAQADTTRLCDALRWYGYACDLLGRPDDAQATYAELLRTASVRGDRRHEAWARVGLAFRAAEAGRTAAAIPDYQRAADLFRELGDTNAEIWALNGLGTALHGEGRYAEARRVYAEVREAARAADYLAAEALAENNLGTLEFGLGDPGLAASHFERAYEIQTELRQVQYAITAGTNLALCEGYLGRLDEAAARLKALLAACHEGGFSSCEPHVLTQLASIRYRQGRFREAAAIDRAILGRDEGNLDVKQRIDTLIGLAGTLWAVDSSAAALEVLQDGYRRWGATLPPQVRIELDLALGEHLLVAGHTAAALVVLDSVATRAGRDGLRREQLAALVGKAGCLRVLQQPARARMVLEAAAQLWETARDVPLDREWREQRGASALMIAGQLATMILEAEQDESSPDAIRHAFDSVQIFKSRTLAERMGALGDSATCTYVSQLVTLSQLQQDVLREDELLLDYYLDTEECLLFAVTRDRAEVVWLPPERVLTTRLRLYRDLLATPISTAPAADGRDRLAEDGRRIGATLLGAAADWIAPDGHVIVVPDGPINLVPFTTLGVAGAGVRWSRVPSATILASLRAQSGRPGGRGILALAGNADAEGQALDGAQAEVALLASRLRNVDLQLEDPEELARYDILHLAAHARIDDQRPWTSEIQLRPRGSGPGLRADWIATQPLRARLTVLSACATASGRVLSGEGVLGLSSAFLNAGVPCVIASLWPVADAATVPLMDRFYRRLASGSTVAAALAEAQAQARLDPATGHPFWWAGFVVVGDGEVRVDLERRPSDWVWLILALPGTGIVLWVLHRRKQAA